MLRGALNCYRVVTADQECGGRTNWMRWLSMRQRSLPEAREPEPIVLNMSTWVKGDWSGGEGEAATN